MTERIEANLTLYLQIVFNDHHINCGSYETQIKRADTDTAIRKCLNDPPHMDDDQNDIVEGGDDKTTDRSLEEQEISPRELNPDGYQ